MTITVVDSQIPLPQDFPMPSSAYDPTSFHLAMRETYDTDLIDAGNLKVVMYFHGSGSPGFLEGPIVDLLVSEGYFVIMAMAPNAPGSSRIPFRHGYGNVNAPHYTAHFIKEAWWVETLVRATDMPNSAKIVLFGHSKGGSAVVSWAAGNTGREVFPSNIKGIIANGTTVGGLGQYNWNDVS